MNHDSQGLPVQPIIRQSRNSCEVTVIPATVFTMGTSANVSLLHPIGTGIDTRDWVSGVLLVRYHGAKQFGEGSFQINLYNLSLSPSDPSVLFLANSDVQSSVFDRNTPAGTLDARSLGSGRAAQAQVALAWIQGVNGTTGSSNVFTISVSLVGRYH